MVINMKRCIKFVLGIMLLSAQIAGAVELNVLENHNDSALYGDHILPVELPQTWRAPNSGSILRTDHMRAYIPSRNLPSGGTLTSRSEEHTSELQSREELV